MQTALEVILNQLVEEVGEVLQITGKINRFGLDSVKPGTETTNRQKLVEELNDVEAMVEVLRDYLQDSGDGLPGLGDRAFIEKRIAKFLHFTKVSMDQGQVGPDAFFALDRVIGTPPTQNED